MCISDPAKFARSHGISVRQVRQVQCTAEHLTSRRDGGTDTRSNIAAACWHCNKLRHARKTPLPADRYRDYVQRRISRGACTTDFSLRVCAHRLIRHSSRSSSAELSAAKTAATHASRVPAAIVGLPGSGRWRPAVVGRQDSLAVAAVARGSTRPTAVLEGLE